MHREIESTNVHRSLSQEIPNKKKTYLTEGVSQNWKHQMAIDQLPRAAASDGTADWNAVNGGGAAFVLAVDEKGETIPGRFLKVRKTRKKSFFASNECHWNHHL